jgi:hypothetical protein
VGLLIALVCRQQYAGYNPHHTGENTAVWGVFMVCCAAGFVQNSEGVVSGCIGSLPACLLTV